MSLIEKAAIDMITAEHAKKRCEVCAIAIDLYVERLDMYVRQKIINTVTRDRWVSQIQQYAESSDEQSLAVIELLHMLGQE